MKLIDGGRLDMTDPANIRDRQPDPDRVALPDGVAADPADDLTKPATVALLAALRGNGACTVGNLAGLLAGPTGWTSSASDEARAVLARLCARGLMAAHPKRGFVFQLTTRGKGLLNS